MVVATMRIRVGVSVAVYTFYDNKLTETVGYFLPNDEVRLPSLFRRTDS